MSDPESGCSVVLNGEIYNHKALRKKIGTRVGNWISTSDTETLLKAFLLWGTSCLDQLRGMFAFSIWDPRSATLWCARDRLGIKPFYYFENEKVFSFASEVRSLLASTLVPRVLCERGLAGFVRYGSVPEPVTLIKGIKSLPAGYNMSVRSARITELRPFWKPMPEVVRPPIEEAESQVRTTLTDSIAANLESDVSVSVFLSGGIDSSAVAALASKASTEPIHTFNVGFEESAYDESPYAELVARKFKTKHHVVRLNLEAARWSLIDAVRAMDMPSIDGANTFIVSRAVADAGFKVVLSGLGGDELFGGYRSFTWLPRFERWSTLFGHVPDGVRAWAGRGGMRGHRIAEMTAAGIGLHERYESLRSLWPKEVLGALHEDLPRLGDDAPSCTNSASRISHLELSGYMRSVLLRDSDVMSMANSLELRVPFLDHALVETCFRCQAADWSAFGQPKGLLIRAIGDLLPREVIQRRKQGFALPMDEWMRGPLRAFCDEGLIGLSKAGIQERMPGIDIQQCASAFLRKELPWARLWQFVVLGHWLNANLK